MSVISKGVPCRYIGLSRRRRHHWGWHFTDWRGSAGGLLSRASGRRNRRWNHRVWRASPRTTMWILRSTYVWQTPGMTFLTCDWSSEAVGF